MIAMWLLCDYCVITAFAPPVSQRIFTSWSCEGYSEVDAAAVTRADEAAEAKLAQSEQANSPAADEATVDAA